MHERLDAEMKAEHLGITSVSTPRLHLWRRRRNLQKRASAICLNALCNYAATLCWRCIKDWMKRWTQNTCCRFLKFLNHILKILEKLSSRYTQTNCRINGRKMLRFSVQAKTRFSIASCTNFPNITLPSGWETTACALDRNGHDNTVPIR